MLVACVLGLSSWHVWWCFVCRSWCCRRIFMYNTPFERCWYENSTKLLNKEEERYSFTAVITLAWTPKICLECLLYCNQSQGRSSHHRNHRQRTVSYRSRNKLISFCKLSYYYLNSSTAWVWHSCRLSFAWPSLWFFTAKLQGSCDLSLSCRSSLSSGRFPARTKRFGDDYVV